mgnify:CR=1 FL=1
MARLGKSSISVSPTPRGDRPSSDVGLGPSVVGISHGLQPLAGIDPLRAQFSEWLGTAAGIQVSNPSRGSTLFGLVPATVTQEAPFVSNPSRGSTLFGREVLFSRGKLRRSSPTPRGDRPSSDPSTGAITATLTIKSPTPRGDRPSSDKNSKEENMRLTLVSNPSRGSTLFGRGKFL